MAGGGKGKHLPAGPEGRDLPPQGCCWRSHFSLCRRDAKRQVSTERLRMENEIGCNYRGDGQSFTKLPTLGPPKSFSQGSDTSKDSSTEQHHAWTDPWLN